MKGPDRVRRTIIAIDDEPHNLLLLEGYLANSGHEVRSFGGGRAALDYLRAGNKADVILLDRMMPEMDGMTFLQELKALDRARGIPVIMQTAAAAPEQVAEGIAAGVYYYLTKPYARDVINVIVSRALSDSAFHQGLEETAVQMRAALRHADRLRMSFRSLDDVRNVSFFLASLFPDPEAALLGITEMMLNAVEHGNLGITYAEKSVLRRSGTWEDEVLRRLRQPEHIAKRATILFERCAAALTLTIQDEGSGFDWTPYGTFEASRARDSHGRGIAMSRLVSFDDVTYIAPGNIVVCRKAA